MWKYHALFSVVFAALTIFAKSVVRGVNSHLATVGHTAVVLVID